MGSLEKSGRDWMSIRPWRAGEEAAGSSARASRSRRIEVDCLSAELNREFCASVRSVCILCANATYHGGIR